MSPLKSILLSAFCVASCAVVHAEAGKLSFDGCRLPAIAVDVPSSTGLTQLYVLAYTEGVTISYEVYESGQTVTWQRFSSMGGAYSQDVASTQSGNVSTLTTTEGNVGYIVTELPSGKSRYFWITDHSAYPFHFNDLTLDTEQTDCSTVWLEVDGGGERIPYYSITGVPQWLSRGYELTYSTLEFDESAYTWNQASTTVNIDGVSNELIHCTPALCSTSYTLSGDRFMKEWGEAQTIESPSYDPTAVDAHARAVQQQREVDNEIKVESELGGSGPSEIHFEAAVTDAALYHEWEMARDAEFDQIFMRFNDLDFDYTFREQGTTYVRLLCANDAGGCEWESETFQIFIGESELKCPNAFSPGVSEGVNDEWKVSYKSIISFDCHIFDRNGRELAHLTDPSQGWDGKRGGRTVGPGVYFYVIKAEGADGKKYKLSGDINVVGYKRNTTTTTSPTD